MSLKDKYPKVYKETILKKELEKEKKLEALEFEPEIWDQIVQEDLQSNFKKAQR